MRRLKKGTPLKIKAMVVRRKNSPAVPPLTPSMSKPVAAECPAAPSMSAGPVLGRAGSTPVGEWMQLIGKVTMPSFQMRVEATTNDAPVFPPSKEEAFDEDGRIKPDFQSQFMPAPRLARDRKSVV